MHATLHLVRHGAVDPAWQGRLYGCLDVPLSEAGKAEAARAAAHLAGRPLAAVFSSGLERTVYGADRIAEVHGLARRDEPGLREIDRGDWARLSFDELEQRDPGAFARWLAAPWTSAAPGGESLGDVAGRVEPVLDRLAAELAGAEVAVVAHRHVLRAAAARAVGRQGAQDLDLPTGVVVTLAWTSVGPVELVAREAFGAADHG